MKFNQILNCDVLEGLQQLPDESVDCIVTSPPYWGLRDYGVEGQYGLEKTLKIFINKLLNVTQECKRVLKKSGVMFWNHGDCYGSSSNRMKNEEETIKNMERAKKKGYTVSAWGASKKASVGLNRSFSDKSIMPKCLALQNYRLILRMIDDQGWILRNTIIWNKPNAMPSSVKDRFSNRYEPVFFFSKSKKYWFDLDAVRVPHTTSSYKSFNRRVKDVKKDQERGFKNKSDQYKASDKEIEQYRGQNIVYNSVGKNPGDVWKIATQPFKDAHFAVFPEKLVMPMIMAGCPSEVCKECGHIRTRITKVEKITRKRKNPVTEPCKERGPSPNDYAGMKVNTVGWTDCKCRARNKYLPGVVLDPFTGVGTTLKVARDLNRQGMGIELNPKYVKIAENRVKGYKKLPDNKLAYGRLKEASKVNNKLGKFINNDKLVKT